MRRIGDRDENTFIHSQKLTKRLKLIFGDGGLKDALRTVGSFNSFWKMCAVNEEVIKRILTERSCGLDDVERAGSCFEDWKRFLYQQIEGIANSEFHKLQEDLMALTNACDAASEEHRAHAEMLNEILGDAIRHQFSGSPSYQFSSTSLHIFGSTVSNLSLPGSSDIDLTLTVSKSEDKDVIATEILDIVSSLAENIGFRIKEKVVKTRVPVLKMEHVERSKQVDLTVNQPNSLLNSDLLRRYTLLDQRVRPLALAVKLWAKNRGVNDPRNSTLTSYAWIILTLHFLQNINPPVIPVLDKIENDNDGPSWSSKNPLDVANLLLNFFAYYTVGCAHHEAVVSELLEQPRFNQFEDVVSIRLVGKYQKFDDDEEDARDESQASEITVALAPHLSAPWWRFCIEDPIDPSHDLGRVIYRFEGQAFITDELYRGFQYLVGLQASGDLLDSSLHELCEKNHSIPQLPALCYNCNKEGHVIHECPDIFCTKCKLIGHMARNCPNGKFCFRCRNVHKSGDCPRGKSDNASIKQLGKSVNVAISGDSLIEQVLTWQVGDFMNKNLLQTSLYKIPMKFNSAERWYNTYFPFILEEVRAQLSQIAEKDFFGCETHRARTVLAKKQHDETLLACYLIVQCGLEEKKVQDKGCLNLGLLFKIDSSLSTSPPSAVHFIQKNDDHCLINVGFPLTQQLSEHNSHTKERHTKQEIELLHSNPDCVIFKAKIMMSNPASREVLGKNNPPSSMSNPQQEGAEGWEILFLGVSTYSHVRICDALSSQESPQEIMDNLLQGESHEKSEDGYDEEIDPLVSARYTQTLNQSQKDAVDAILSAALSGSKHKVQLIKGPPGTGKTSTLVALLQSLIASSLKVHATAPTNIAVCELAKRCFLESMKEETVGEGICSRHDMKLRPARFLLIGTAERLGVNVHEVDDELDKLLLDSRIARILEASSMLDTNIRAICNILQSRRSTANETSEMSIEEKASYSSRNASSLNSLIGQLLYAFDILLSEAPTKALQTMHITPQIYSVLSKLTCFSCEDLISWFAQVFNNSKIESQISKCIDVVLEDLEKMLSRMRLVADLSCLKTDILHEAVLVFSTVNVGGRNIFNFASFDVTVVDEATQLVEAETAIILRKRLGCLVLVGDDKQLPATVISMRCKEFGYDESMFGRLLQLDYPHYLLNIQYRMHPDISRWPRVQFYDGNVTDGENVCSESYCKDWHDTFPPFAVYNIDEGTEEIHEHGSKYNEIEAMLVRKLVNTARRMDRSISIGVISPYSAQVDMLSHLQSTCLSKGNKVTVKVSTIDGFQGQECDIVLLSAVRSNDSNRIGFLKDIRRLNVAITRPRFSLIIIANVKTVSANETWSNLISHAVQLGCMHNIENHKLISSCVKAYLNSERSVESLIMNNGGLFEHAPWDVSFANDLKKMISKVDLNMKKKLLKIFLGLANGKWPKFEIVSNLVSPGFKEIVHIYRVLHFRLVWSVDVNKSTGVQYLRLWDAVLESDLPRAIRRVESFLNSYSQEYLTRCSRKDSNGKSYTPVSFSIEDFVWYKDTTRRPVSDSTVSDESNLCELERCHIRDAAMLTKFYRMTSDAARLLASATETTHIELPFEMSATEEEIVRYQGLQLIYGRSGTGKTSVIMRKMFLNCEQTKTILSTDVTCRQLLVTASPILCDAIRSNFNNMVKTAQESRSIKIGVESLTPKVNDAVVKVSANTRHHQDQAAPSFMHILPEEYPLIITFKKLLIMLDNTLSNSFFSTADINVDDGLVDFERFSSHYFPHFDENKIVGDAAQVFTEIMSHIKGSVEALNSSKGYLSSDDYLSLSDNRHSHLSKDQRSMIYDLFLKYEKLKSQTYHGEYDLLDVVCYVYRTISSQSESFRGQLMDAVFVDEVQDLVPAQIALLKFICPNANSFTLAGDTAQTIAHGVGFRFDSVKDIFYNEFRGNQEHDKASPEKARIRHLSQNFRTHSGIVAIANSIVDLMTHFFPDTIDALDPETSSVFGPKPIFLDSSDDIVVELFEKSSLNSCDFGAEQVILVRDDEAKRAVMQTSGVRALVLTVLEAKGMEFTDCLVYNFFKSSPFKSNDWRVIYDVINSLEKYPDFDVHRHASLCVELKLLYVLLTRARQNLIIFDEDRTSRGPMLSYWQEKDLVELKPLDESIRSMFISSSSPQEWNRQGEEFFERKQFGNARLCFQRAGNEYQERLCNAAEQEQEGDKLAVSSPPLARKCYLKSADIYAQLGSGHVHRVASCFEKAKEFEKAGEQYKLIFKYKKAAYCFETAASKETSCIDKKLLLWMNAALEHKELALSIFSEEQKTSDDNREVRISNQSEESVKDALRCAYNTLDYHKVIDFLASFLNEHVIPLEKHSSLFRDCVKKAAIYYHGIGNVFKMMEFVSMFATTEEKRIFLKRYKYFDNLLGIEIEDGCHLEVANIYLGLLDYENAATYYEKAALEQEQGSTVKANMILECVRCTIMDVTAKCLDDKFLLKSISPEDRPKLMNARSLLAAVPYLPLKRIYSCVIDLLDNNDLLENKSASSLQFLKSIIEITDEPELGDEGWALKMTALRLIGNVYNRAMSSHTSAGDPKKGKAGGNKKTLKAKPVTEQLPSLPPWKELMSCCQRINSMVDRIQPILQAQMERSSTVTLSPEDKKLLLQCLSYFQLSLVDTSTAYISPNALVSGLQMLQGYKTVFQLHQPNSSSSLSSSSSSSSSSLRVISTIRMTIKEFAQCASKFFKNEYDDIFSLRTDIVQQNYDEISPFTLHQRAQRTKDIFEKKVAVPEFHTTVKSKCELLVALDQIVLTTKIPTAHAIRGLLAEVVIPNVTCLKDLLELVDIRRECATPGTRLRQMMERFHIRSFGQPKINFDTIARALLFADLCNHAAPVATRLQKILHSELKKERFTDEAIRIDVRVKLVESFLWESTSNDIKPIPEWPHGTFLWSLIQGSEQLENDRYKRGGLLWMLLKKWNPEKGLPSFVNKGKCFSPPTFVALLQKYFVWLQLLSKHCRDVKMPNSLAVNVLCRVNKAYSDTITKYKELSQAEANTESFKQRKNHAFYRLQNLSYLAMDMIDKMDKATFEKWASGEDLQIGGVGAKKASSSSSSIVERYEDERNWFIEQLLMLVLTFVVNFPSRNVEHRTKMCVKIAESLSENSRSAIKFLPSHVRLHLLHKLNAKNVDEKFAAYQQISEDGLIFMHVNQHLNIKVKMTVKMIDVCGDGLVLLPYTAPPPLSIMARTFVPASSNTQSCSTSNGTTDSSSSQANNLSTSVVGSDSGLLSQKSQNSFQENLGDDYATETKEENKTPDNSPRRKMISKVNVSDPSGNDPSGVDTDDIDLTIDEATVDESGEALVEMLSTEHAAPPPSFKSTEDEEDELDVDDVDASDATAKRTKMKSIQGVSKRIVHVLRWRLKCAREKISSMGPEENFMRYFEKQFLQAGYDRPWAPNVQEYMKLLTPSAVQIKNKFLDLERFILAEENNDRKEKKSTHYLEMADLAWDLKKACEDLMEDILPQVNAAQLLESRRYDLDFHTERLANLSKEIESKFNEWFESMNALVTSPAITTPVSGTTRSSNSASASKKAVSVKEGEAKVGSGSRVNTRKKKK